jgi:hypothetical protein
MGVAFFVEKRYYVLQRKRWIFVSEHASEKEKETAQFSLKSCIYISMKWLALFR